MSVLCGYDVIIVMHLLPLFLLFGLHYCQFLYICIAAAAGAGTGAAGEALLFACHYSKSNNKGSLVFGPQCRLSCSVAACAPFCFLSQYQIKSETAILA